MNLKLLKDQFLNLASDNKDTYLIKFGQLSVNIYVKSVKEKDNKLFFIGKEGLSKYLYVLQEPTNSIEFEGDEINISVFAKNLVLKRCNLTTSNRKKLQTVFEFLKPKVVGKRNSFGFGDRLGLANAGHLRSLEGTDFIPVLAQQSIRELTRTNRTPDQVMDAAVWAVFQEGYQGLFGSDADHLKSFADIDLMVKAGFTMFTFDPSEYVDNRADAYDLAQLNEKIKNMDWSGLNDNFSSACDRYLSKPIRIKDSFILNPQKEELLRAYAKYGNAIIHISKMFEYLKKNYPEVDTEVEISVDETESVTSPFEHYFVVNELKRMNVDFVSLAPRFVGSFEKGIDYKGDKELFKTEYIKHLAISNYFGNYKISLHSGSDKFTVYEIIGKLKSPATHIKTAGTSFLEALKVVALKKPDLFRQIFDFSCGLYETEKLSYHVFADLKVLKPAAEYSDEQLPELFNSDDARQVLHVTFGKILTSKDINGKLLFKDVILQTLIENEELHYEILIKHFKRHLFPFISN